MEKKINKIAFILPALEGGGVEKVFILLARGFLNRGIKVDLVLAKARGSLITSIPSSANMIDLDVPQRLRLIRSYFPLRKYLNRLKPDLALHVWGYFDIIPIRALQIERIPYFFVLHNQPDYFYDLPKPKQILAVYSAKKTIRETYELMDKGQACLGAVSSNVAQSFSQLASVPKEVFKIVHNPIDPNIQNLAREPVDHPWFNNMKPPLIGVGRLHPQKNWPLLLQSMTYPEVSGERLVLVGEGPLRSYLGTLVRDLGISDRVLFWGYDSNPYRLIAKSKALVLPSKYEGLGVVVLEALALGVQVVILKENTASYELIDEGRLGHVADLSTPELLAFSIRKAFDSPIPKEILEQSLIKYQLDNVINEYLDVFEELQRR